MANNYQKLLLHCNYWADSDKPMQKDTIFRVVSMSKPITSVAMMILYEQAKLLLFDPVSKYIPEFKEQKITIFLSQTTPFRHHFNLSDSLRTSREMGRKRVSKRA
jgi:CubicO group peptidase (beta-lactamase class C family)